MAPQLTPSQTVGPYFAIGMTWDDGPYVVPEGTPGAFRLRGRVLDGEGKPVPDAMLESWQADPDGRYNHPDDPRGAEAAGFRGFARVGTDGDGGFGIYTVKPGQVPGPHHTTQAPHLEVSVFARGLLNRLVTRIYFADEEQANAIDPILRSVPEERRSTLLARAVPEGGYRFDIHLQGEGETVFFAV